MFVVRSYWYKKNVNFFSLLFLTSRAKHILKHWIDLLKEEEIRPVP